MRALVGRETGDAGKTLRTCDASHLRVRTLWSALGRAAAAHFSGWGIPWKRRWMGDAGGSWGKPENV
ncbi:hypothetical protein NDU88_004005 [Pleurodeles waltl]|uniref:Uncharacterized protein n=1 Tax=Pleurodeles waltl TaxID=8319 RepID=A0AAV7PB63_PLEWA|nr:hypothetical protein NDU88_004005 [Pleurodeles waltl]